MVSFIFIVVNLMFLEKNLSRIHAELDIKLMFKLYVYKEKCSCYTVILLYCYSVYSFVQGFLELSFQPSQTFT